MEEFIGAESIYYAGIEGGGTHSTLVIADKKGKLVLEIGGGPLNVLQVGFEASAKLIIDLLSEACQKLHIEKPISLGLSLSGAVGDELQLKLMKILHACKSSVVPKNSISISDDSEGSLATIFGDQAGLIVISGTGTCGLYRSSKGVTYKAGGWGHLIGGDEASGYWISQQAIRRTLNNREAIVIQPHSTENVWNLMKAYFAISEPNDILPHFYTKQNMKSQISGFTKVLAKDCLTSADPFIAGIFYEAGEWLGRHIIALITQCLKAEKDAFIPKELEVFAVGSVWNAIPLLRNGLISILKSSKLVGMQNVETVVFYQSKVSSAIGAAFLAQNTLENESNRMIYDHKLNRVVLDKFTI